MSTVQSSTIALPLLSLSLPSLSLSSAATTLPSDNQSKVAFTPPKLMFLIPELTKQGGIDELASGIIGTFS